MLIDEFVADEAAQEGGLSDTTVAYNDDLVACRAEHLLFIAECMSC
jgi:hypothetical protein